MKSCTDWERLVQSTRAHGNQGPDMDRDETDAESLRPLAIEPHPKSSVPQFLRVHHLRLEQIGILP